MSDRSNLLFDCKIRNRLQHLPRWRRHPDVLGRHADVPLRRGILVVLAALQAGDRNCGHIARVETKRTPTKRLPQGGRTEDSMPTGLIGFPDSWPRRYNGGCNRPCDMISGPCTCGAWHSLSEAWVVAALEINNDEITNTDQVRTRQSTPQASNQTYHPSGLALSYQVSTPRTETGAVLHVEIQRPR